MTIKSYFRNIKRNKADSFINLAGLSIALAVFILISLYTKNELTYDSHHKNADRIFRITTALISPNGETTDMALANPPFAQMLKDQCPEIEEMACIEVEDFDNIEFAHNKFKDVNVRMATPSLFDMFTYQTILGNQSDFLRTPNTIILTESLSEQIFGNSNPLGQKILLGDKNFEVTGVIKDLPANSDLQFEAVIPSDFYGPGDVMDWGEYYVYLETQNTEISSLENKIAQITNEVYGNIMKEMGDIRIIHKLQPLKSIHFDNTKLADTPRGNKTMVLVFLIIAILILLVAGINYNNLMLSQSEKRTKAFSIRKTVGCSKQQIIYSIISESLLNVFLAFLIAVIIVGFLLPHFNVFFNKDFHLIAIADIALPLMIIFTLFAILTALYPGIKIAGAHQYYNSGFNNFGKTLVTIQNIVTIVMITGLFVVWSQIHFMKNAELGFNSDQLMAISIPPEPNSFPGKEVLQQELLSMPEVKSLAFGGGGTNMGLTNWMKSIMAVKDENGEEVQFVLNQPQIDENYIDVLGMELLEGRNFSADIPSDNDKSAIINETYARIMGWDNPLGKVLHEEPKQTIIGVIKDFNFDGLYNPIEPLKFTMLNDQPAYLFIKAEPRNLHAIQEKWETLYPENPFNFQFMDQRMASLYQQQEKDMKVFSLLTLIVILLSCMGLYGITMHLCIKRTKEIGIRKVNGARIMQIIIMLNNDFIKWVFVAYLFACPIVIFIMKKWLAGFAYQTHIGWWIFVLAGIITLGIALLTVSWQSLKAATKNPVESLKYE